MKKHNIKILEGDGTSIAIESDDSDTAKRIREAVESVLRPAESQNEDEESLDDDDEVEPDCCPVSWPRNR
jgi:hypothetical protein